MSSEVIAWISLGISGISLTVSIIVSVRQYFKDRINLRIFCDFKQYFSAISFRDGIEILAVNNGFRPVEIRKAGIVVGNEFRNFDAMGKLSLPKILNQGESVEIMLDLIEVVSYLNQFKREEKYIYPFVKTSNGEIFKGKLPRVFKDKSLA